MSWKKIKELEKYLVNFNGEIKNIKTNKTLKWILNSGGYYQCNIMINKKCIKISKHRLIYRYYNDNYNLFDKLIDFNGDLLVIDHIDNNKENNNISNLQLTTFRKNLSKDKLRVSKLPTGVVLCKNNRFRSVISIKNVRYHLGYYDNSIEASNKYQEVLFNWVNNNILPI